MGLSEPYGLSTAQSKAIFCLVQGKSITAAATAADVCRNTIYSWLKESTFTQFLNELKTSHAERLRDQLLELSRKAIDTLTAILDDVKAAASVRLKAALAVLNRPQFPNRGWALPTSIEPPNKQQVLDNLANLEAEYRALRLEQKLNRIEQKSTTPPPAQDADPFAADPLNKIEHIFTASAPQQPVRADKIGRNAPCSCGSGKKFKFCCRNKPSSTPNPARITEQN